MEPKTLAVVSDNAENNLLLIQQPVHLVNDVDLNQNLPQFCF